MIYYKKIKKIEKNLRKIFKKTPLQKSLYLSEKYVANIFLKREDLTLIRSFKIRGALNFISQYLKKDKKPFFVCASAGNHAQGVAFSCANFKVKGKIFMPITTPKQKIDMVKKFGKDFIEISLIGDTFDDSLKTAQFFCKENKGVFIHPFDDEKIIDGQATVALEILEEMKNKIDYIFVPLGGGGLVSGIINLFAEKSPKTKIIIIVEENSLSLQKSLKSQRIVGIEKINTFIDGTAVKKIGEKNFKIIQKYKNLIVLNVPENRVAKTLLEIFYNEGIALEPAGVLAIDALKNFDVEKLKSKNIVCVASGGNLDFERLPEIKEKAMQYDNLRKYFILKLPQRPGALKEFLINCLCPEDDIIRFEYLKKHNKEFGSILIGIEVINPNNFKKIEKIMKKNNFQFEDITNNKLLSDFLI